MRRFHFEGDIAVESLPQGGWPASLARAMRQEGVRDVEAADDKVEFCWPISQQIQAGSKRILTAWSPMLLLTSGVVEPNGVKAIHYAVHLDGLGLAAGMMATLLFIGLAPSAGVALSGGLSLAFGLMIIALNLTLSRIRFRAFVRRAIESAAESSLP